MKHKSTIFLALVLILTAGLCSGGEKTKWLNIHVEETQEGAIVDVHLPFSLVLTAVNSVNTKEFKNGMVHLRLEDTEIDLAALLDEIKNAPDGDYVKVRDKEADVVVKKSKGSILIDVTEKRGEKAKVNVRIPAEFLSSIRFDKENRLDVKAILSALEGFETGDIVTVDADDARVRVWIE